MFAFRILNRLLHGDLNPLQDSAHQLHIELRTQEGLHRQVHLLALSSPLLLLAPAGFKSYFSERREAHHSNEVEDPTTRYQVQFHILKWSDIPVLETDRDVYRHI